MFKVILGIVAVSALLSIAPASAAEMDCTDANMTKASADMDKMPAGEMKTMGHEGNDHGEGNDGQERHGRLQNAHEQSHGNGNVQVNSELPLRGRLSWRPLSFPTVAGNDAYWHKTVMPGRAEDVCS
jgi:hypothetical protein